jgi:hypothetical protein
MATDSTWRTPDGRWLVDLIIDEPGTCARIWDEGQHAADLPTLGELDGWLIEHAGAAVADLEPATDPDPWCE